MTIDSIINKKEAVAEAIKKAHDCQEKYNAFVTIIDDAKNDTVSDSPLAGIPYALKDNISTKGILTTASSNILNDYVPVYNATVYEKLIKSGAVLIGKTVLDELAMGGTGTTGHTGIVKNPWDVTRQIGGSSAGSAVAVALGIVPFAIGSDTGDSIRKPAAFGGIVGFKPTYGRVSRYGLFAFASSLDHVGCFTRSVKDCAYVIDVIKGYDKKDMTSLKDDSIIYANELENDISSKKLFYIKEICDINEYPEASRELKEVLNNFELIKNKYEQMGLSVTGVSIDRKLLNAIYPTYITISCAEATSNNSNLTGILYGLKENANNINELMFKTRTKGFSELIKRRFILGSYILQKENQERLFKNAQRIRRLLVNKLNELFNEYDGMILPSSGGIAPKFNDQMDKLSNRYLLLENHLSLANFGGYPSISIPSGFVNKMPISVNITCKQGNDALTLNLAYKLESIMEYKGQIAKGDDNV